MHRKTGEILREPRKKLGRTNLGKPRFSYDKPRVPQEKTKNKIGKGKPEGAQEKTR